MIGKPYIVLGLFLFICYAAPAKGQTSDSLVISFKNGQKVTLALSQIQKITFDTLTANVNDKNTSTNGLQLLASYPNPLRSSTTIDFDIATTGLVKISIYDAKGNAIRNLQVNSQLGRNQIVWDGLDNSGIHVPSGEYFYEVRFKNDIQVRKMVVIK